VLKDPASAVVYTGRTEDGLGFVIRAWVKKEDYWTVNFDLNETAKKAFDMAGIEVPYKQMDVRIRKD
jgi:small conductance mechanosensitive channel